MTGALIFLAGFLACIAVIVLLGRWLLRRIVG